MNEKQASNVLRKYNKWRRCGNGKMQEPRVIGEAIDVALRVIAEHGPAMDTLRKIAAGKRRTREQRLALSCVTFLDRDYNGSEPQASVRTNELLAAARNL